MYLYHNLEIQDGIYNKNAKLQQEVQEEQKSKIKDKLKYIQDMWVKGETLSVNQHRENCVQMCNLIKFYNL